MTDAPTPAQAPLVQPLDPPMTPFAVGGTALWALAALVTWLAGADSSTVWICVAGFLMGFPGIATMIRHDKRRAARKAAGEVLRD